MMKTMSPAAEVQLDSGKGLDYLAKFMSSLHGDQEKLRVIQSEYDNLSLLGQLLSVGSSITDISSMRADFNKLVADLLSQLAGELQKKAILGLRSNARVAIDILVRNLFERTADIGFLATDADIRAHAQAHVLDATAVAADARSREHLKERFAEYVRKYSVYHDIILLGLDGTVLVRLHNDGAGAVCRDPLVREALNTPQPYLEISRQTELLPGDAAPLIYAYRVTSPEGEPVGVLCLCFRLQDECARIFRGLVAQDDWTVVTILDGDGRVIASSDIYQFPPGARLERVDGDACRIVRFAGREYLATTQATHGYQGYMGPGWVGHALAPLNHAFDMAVAHEMQAVPEALREGVLRATNLFSPQLREIPVRAASIQGNLNRAVWNGSAWLSRADAALNTSFAKVLLREFGNTGARTSEVFSQSAHNLYETVISSVLADCASRAALAMDIMDRNLYERANDCRWWALTAAFREALAAQHGPDAEAIQRLGGILKEINGLYTVYSNLMIFDVDATVVAVSNPAYSGLRGQAIHAEWVRQVLALGGTQSYAVSAFERSPLYGGRPTYIYGAAIRDPEHLERVIGGVAIVFDSEPQFVAMLDEALPRRADGSVTPGAFAVYAERDGHVIASTDASLKPGMRLDLDGAFFRGGAGDSVSNIVERQGRYVAVGSRCSSGYREYKSASDSYRNDVVALVIVPLSDHVEDVHRVQARRRSGVRSLLQGTGVPSVEIATFHIGEQWFGLRSDSEIEAIAHRTITALPGAQPWVRGCLMVRDEPVTVVDIGAFLPGIVANRNGVDAQIVVVKLAGQRQSIAFEVDELGEVTDVEVSRIEHLPELSRGPALIADAVVKPAPGSADTEILILLSVEQLGARVLAAPEQVIARGMPKLVA